VPATQVDLRSTTPSSAGSHSDSRLPRQGLRVEGRHATIRDPAVLDAKRVGHVACVMLAEGHAIRASRASVWRDFAATTPKECFSRRLPP
jgi:hypothetical protein